MLVINLASIGTTAVFSAMLGDQITIEWLVSKWSGVRETVPRSRVKRKGDLDIGMEVQVSYKRGQFKARIIGLGKFIHIFVANLLSSDL